MAAPHATPDASPMALAVAAPKATAKATRATPMLEVRALHAWYGESHVLHGVDFDVAEGEVVTLLGRNGSGRTSTLRAIMGLTGARKGSVRVRGQETRSEWTNHGSSAVNSCSPCPALAIRASTRR